MKKKMILLLCLITIGTWSHAQEKIENATVHWPAAYKWKIIRQEADSLHKLVAIIPGKEKLAKATIVGIMRVNIGVRYVNLDELIRSYQHAIDTGTVLKVLEQDGNAELPWILFKVETPVTPKYPVAESDLYYVVQGNYGVYENYVSIKQPNLSPDFIVFWSKIFKETEIKID